MDTCALSVIQYVRFNRKGVRVYLLTKKNNNNVPFII